MQQPIAFDPFVPASALEELDVRGVTLDELLTTADFVSVHCPHKDRLMSVASAAQKMGSRLRTLTPYGVDCRSPPSFESHDRPAHRRPSRREFKQNA